MPLRTRSKTRFPASSTSGSTSAKKPDDKENVKKSAFQPPSPLTSSKRKAQKVGAKKILSPNCNSQWNHGEASAASAARQPRSSPIHAGYNQQDRDHRASSSHAATTTTLKRNMSTDSNSGELDLMAKTLDDFGPPIIDCLNLGSFAEDSPPRETKPYRREARGSPTYRGGGYSYIPSSRNASGYQQQQQPSSYYGPPPPGYSYPGYHPSPYSGPDQTAPWASPRAYDYDQRPPSAQHKHPPYDPPASPPSKKSRRWEGSPEKSKSIKNMRSPFRSPISNPESAKKLKRSPIWAGAGTPSIGMYGSFGMMDTPGAHLDGFSPMGPAFASFEDSPPLPLEGEVLDARLSLVAGDDRRVPPPAIPQRRTPRSHLSQDSPGFNFINEMAHMPGTLNLPSSPVRAKRDSRERDNPRYYDKDRRDRPPSDRAPQMPGPPPPKRPSPPSTASKRTIFMSPLAPSSHQHSDRRASWYDSRQAPGPFRLELGDTFAKPSETRRGLEGINSMMRGTPVPQRSGPPPNHPDAYDPRGLPYRDGSTLGKVGGLPGRMPQSRGGHGPPPPYVSSLPPHQGVMPLSAPRYPSSMQPSPSIHHSSSLPRSSQPPLKIVGTPSSNAEKMSTPSSQRRNPCNCKKSKCLKLYCECFAGEMYCDGCNCNDCRNNKTHEDVRSKAMKDTRAKNPNAFKPRIASRSQVGPSGSPPSAHNMGCKCKRSECLKKYCECFQAGVMCGNKCKCVDCLNYVGSQALIDKRRKIKDHRGADFAMRIADEAWKGKHSAPAARVSSTPSSSSSRHPAPSPAPVRPPRSSHGQHMPPAPHQMQRTSSGPQHHSHPLRGTPQSYLSHRPPTGHPPVGYSSYHLHPQGQHSSSKTPANIRGGHPHPIDSRAPTKPSMCVDSRPSEPKLKDSKPSSSRAIARAEEVQKPRDAKPVVVPLLVPPLTKMEDMEADAAPKTPTSAKMADKNADATPKQSMAHPSLTKSSPLIKTPAAAASKPAAKLSLVVKTPAAAASKPAAKLSPVVKTPATAASKPAAKLSPVVNTLAITASKPVAKLIPVVATPADTSRSFRPLKTPAPNVPKSVMKLESTEPLKAPPKVAPQVATPRTPGVRLGYDPSSSKKNCHLSLGQNEATFPHFGNMPEQPKTTALAVFSFLSNDEIYNAALVCKRWNRLAMGEELWQF